MLPRSMYHCFGLQVNYKEKNRKLIFMVQDDNGVLSVYLDDYVMENQQEKE